ncbi:copper chaperone PCu(A)C [Thalassotalea sp. HSM 43]|uniref:copper chaperone PCu(A)C n=1 Tax=Thalassotalea sp. HSM 43 TaxID=2552945 RepID=UPI00107FD591|nr:copper chaperone PCu(A)C [Thalassotalea sp. HSM 43]QBY03829.1 copper chaperone PCu(A)C [Thalassotalea sp. HSM 43]
MKKILSLAFALFTFDIAAHHLIIEQPYAKETIPGSKVNSAYMVINNHSDKSLKLLSVTSPISDRIELHEHTFVDQMMKMQQVDAITIEAGDYVALQPHGYHLMIFKPKQALKAGKEIELSLYFDDGSTATIKVPVVGLSKKSNP